MKPLSHKKYDIPWKTEDKTDNCTNIYTPIYSYIIYIHVFLKRKCIYQEWLFESFTMSQERLKIIYKKKQKTTIYTEKGRWLIKTNNIGWPRC